VRVLVVDDEVDARDLVVHILGASRAEVVAAASAKEALEMLERAQFEVIITDIGMPEEDGYTLIRKVRAMQTSARGRRRSRSPRSCAARTGAGRRSPASRCIFRNRSKPRSSWRSSPTSLRRERAASSIDHAALKFGGGVTG
jgi:CheY-like chemotaxis protein